MIDFDRQLVKSEKQALTSVFQQMIVFNWRCQNSLGN